MAESKRARRKGKPAWNEAPHFGAVDLHEAMYIAGYFSRSVEDELVKHRAVKNDPELLALAESAQETLTDLYQKIANAGTRAMEAMAAEEKQMKEQE